MSSDNGGSNIGAVIGGIISIALATPTGGASLSYFGLFVAGGAYIGGAIDPPSTPDQRGPRLTDLSIQGEEYGPAKNKTWGGQRQTGQIIHSTKIIETETKERRTTVDFWVSAVTRQ
jgi:hypothetical protein